MPGLHVPPIGTGPALVSRNGCNRPAPQRFPGRPQVSRG
ncbi:hypothetical protein L083_0786 [Actinoplanes sp. N902-109]|nr:hypothetical protein L083_0786 [Actinoplanes sp. N902-109]